MNMKLLWVESQFGIELFPSKLILDGKSYTVGGIVERKYEDGMVYECWILIEE